MQRETRDILSHDPKHSCLPTNTNALFSSLMSRDHYPFGQQFLSSSSSRRDDELSSDHGDHYFFNSSTTRLAGASPFIDHSGYRLFIFFLFYILTHPLQVILARIHMVVLTILQPTLIRLQPAFLPLQTQVLAPQSITRLGRQTARFQCPQKR